MNNTASFLTEVATRPKITDTNDGIQTTTPGISYLIAAADSLESSPQSRTITTAPNNGQNMRHVAGTRRHIQEQSGHATDSNSQPAPQYSDHPYSPPRSNEPTIQLEKEQFSDNKLLNMCNRKQWRQLTEMDQSNPAYAVRSLSMRNHIKTTLLHQAITGKEISTSAQRLNFVEALLQMAPVSAQIRNGYNSLPIHTATQRNIHFRAAEKEVLIPWLLDTYPDSVGATGGISGRTPIHLLLTDYLAGKILAYAINKGPSAVRIPDKKGFLPIHIACTRHCSIEKIKILIDAYPESLFSRTDQGDTPLDLAKSKKTKTQPNFELINYLQSRMNDTNLTTMVQKPARVSITGKAVIPMITKSSSGIDHSFYLPPNQSSEDRPQSPGNQHNYFFSINDVGEQAEV